jgi:hypothetical protein
MLNHYTAHTTDIQFHKQESSMQWIMDDIDVNIRNLLYTNQNKRDYNSNAYIDNISSIGNIISSTSFSLFFWECLCTIEYVYEYEFIHEYVNDN